MVIVVYDHKNNGLDIRSTFIEYFYQKKKKKKKKTRVKH